VIFIATSLVFCVQHAARTQAGGLLPDYCRFVVCSQ